MDKKFLIAGATGKTGRIIVQMVLDRGDRPRILVRDQDLAQNLFGDQVDVYVGDVRQPESLLPAVSGVDILISAIGTRTPVGKNCPKRVDYEGVINLIQAARESGVQRFILISSISVTQPNHPMNCFGRILEWKLKGENALRESGLSYAIIRPGGLVDSSEGEKLWVLDQGDKILGTISRTALAETCLCAADYPHNLHITFEIIESEEYGIRRCGEIFSNLNMDPLPST
jgi:uncharacterized protein YbjT (DUF2867 family)